MKVVVAAAALMVTLGSAASSTGAAGPPSPILCKLPRGTSQLPATARRGLIQHLAKYPAVHLATPAQRARAAQILRQLKEASVKGNWHDQAAVARAGYKTRPEARKPGDSKIHYFHAELRGERRSGFTFDPQRPKAVIYANAPGRPFMLVGAMWSMRRGERGPTPAGPILRWHSHIVCVKGNERGTKPLAGNRCPAGARLRQGTEMLHVWFTPDLRSAYAHSAPEPELCAANLIPRGYCRRKGYARKLEHSEGRAPTSAELTPSIEAALPRESYPPRSTAPVVIFNHAEDMTVRVFRAGSEGVMTRSSLAMNGTPMTSTRRVGSSPVGGKTIRIRIGNWTSGLYFVRLRAANGRRGYAPFVVRPRRLGENRVAVVMPTLTWQAYNMRDDDGDGVGDTWYSDAKRRTVRLGRPYLNRGVPSSFRRHDLPFLRWLDRSARDVDVLSQADIERVPSARRLADSYDLVVFPGHHEYVTRREYDLIEGYRDRGGNLMFLTANNFFWRVVRHGPFIEKTKKWRNLGRPEARLIGVQYAAWGRKMRRPWIARASRHSSWVYAGTGLEPNSAFGDGGIEIDKTVEASPPSVQVLAEIPHLLGPGLTAQMTYYETPSGAKVFAAGAFALARTINRDPVIARLVTNVWERLTQDGRSGLRSRWHGLTQVA